MTLPAPFLSRSGLQRPFPREDVLGRMRGEPLHLLVHGHEDRTPERLYERRWALTLLDTVLDRLRAEMARAGKAEVFDVLRVFLSDTGHVASYPEAAKRIDLTEPAARKAVQRLRERYRELLREEVACTVSTPQEVDGELRYLLSVFTLPP